MDNSNSQILNISRAAPSLPLIVTPRNKIGVGFISFWVAAGLYILSNHHPAFEPSLLPMTSWDHAIPFLPWTVWIYTSEYFYFVVIYLLCRETLNINKFVYAIMSLQVVSVAIFMLWPTTYPRDLYPLPDGLDSLTHWVFSSLRHNDSPTNCAPSLHVSSVMLCAFLFFNEQREKLPIFLGWGTLIALSTLTTKQHYVVDVVTGLMMAVLFHWVFFKKFSYYSHQRN